MMQCVRLRYLESLRILFFSFSSAQILRFSVCSQQKNTFKYHFIHIFIRFQRKMQRAGEMETENKKAEKRLIVKCIVLQMKLSHTKLANRQIDRSCKRRECNELCEQNQTKNELVTCKCRRRFVLFLRMFVRYASLYTHIARSRHLESCENGTIYFVFASFRCNCNIIFRQVHNSFGMQKLTNQQNGSMTWNLSLKLQ